MSTGVIRAGDLVRVPWKNGGGTTAEIAAYPEGSTFESFGWRLSMADVASDGPFSSFPGIDRTLFVIEGGGIDLDVDGRTHRLDAASPGCAFPGDAATVGRLVAGPIRDLNVMTRRGRFAHRARLVDEGRLAPRDASTFIVIFALDDSLEVETDGTGFRLGRFDALRLDGRPTPLLIAGGRAILVEIEPAATP